MSLEKIKHYPVMLNQILSIISPQHGGTFIDCTFGGGGYSKAILNYPKTKVIALDRDKFAKQRADDILKKFPNRFKFFHTKFSNLGKILNFLGHLLQCFLLSIDKCKKGNGLTWECLYNQLCFLQGKEVFILPLKRHGLYGISL